MKTLMVLFVALTLSACGIGTERVPAGHVGRIQSPSGFENDVLGPGNHSCWGRDKMYLMETTDINVEIPMDVLCQDSLNFKFTINLLVSLDVSDEAQVKAAFKDLKPIHDNVITVEQLFNTYVRANAAQEAQKVIGKYETSQIVENRAAIIEEVQTAVTNSSEHGLVKVKRVALSNLDFPDVITKAQEQKAQRNVEIDTAKAQGEIDLAKGRAQLQLAELEAQKKLLQSQAIADANKILGASITAQFLAYEQIQAMLEAAKGDNNVFIMPYKDDVNGQIDTAKWQKPETLVDQELIKKLNAARDASKNVDTTVPAPK